MEGALARAARAQAQMPRLGSEDPFRPDLYARVQNFKSNLLQSVHSGMELWRGHGAWSTSARHQRVTVKIRYRSDAKSADAYARYMVKEGKGLDGGTPEAWNDKEKGFDAPQRVREWMKEGDERWFKLVYSPEKQFDDVEGMVKHSMSKAAEHLGTRLDWFAVRHYDGGKDHVHVFLRGRDELGNTLAIDKQYIKFGFRDSAQRYVTYHPKFGLGERSTQEIAEGRERSAQIREHRKEVRELVHAATREGLISRKQQQYLVSDVYNASPKHLDEIKGNMRGLLDSAENVWRERSSGVGVWMGGLPIDRRKEPVTRDLVGRKIDRAEREGHIDALDADRFRQSLNRNTPEAVHRAVDDAVKVKTGTGRDAGQSQDAERIKRGGGLSL